MAILSFKKRFAGKIRNGSKRQTIRADRKYPISPGDKLYLYTGLRTKQCKKLREVVCKDVEKIVIIFNSGIDKIMVIGELRINELTSLELLNAFAKQDGFEDWFDMREFWRDNHPGKIIFRGTLITW